MLAWWGGAIPKLPWLLFRPAGGYEYAVGGGGGAAGWDAPEFRFFAWNGSCHENPSNDTASPAGMTSVPRLWSRASTAFLT